MMACSITRSHDRFRGRRRVVRPGSDKRWRPPFFPSSESVNRIDTARPGWARRHWCAAARTAASRQRGWSRTDAAQRRTTAGRRAGLSAGFRDGWPGPWERLSVRVASRLPYTLQARRAAQADRAHRVLRVLFSSCEPLVRLFGRVSPAANAVQRGHVRRERGHETARLSTVAPSSRRLRSTSVRVDVLSGPPHGDATHGLAAMPGSRLRPRPHPVPPRCFALRLPAAPWHHGEPALVLP